MKSSKSKIKPIILCGPTASGKTALALQLAQELSKHNKPVIINADSQQVYKEIPILSAQPSLEEKNLVPHELFGIINGNEDFNVAIWLEKLSPLINDGRLPIITGGNGMYLNALYHGLAEIPDIPEEIRLKTRAMSREELAQHLGEKADGNTSRMRRNLEVKLATGKYISEFHGKNSGSYTPDDFTILNMNVSRETVYENINTRFKWMMSNGAVEEVKSLLKLGYPRNLPVMKAIGVSEIEAYLNGEMTIDEAIDKASQRSRNYAKRQMTWFRNQLPDSKIDVASFDQAINLIS